jgi:hypothetical protein
VDKRSCSACVYFHREGEQMHWSIPVGECRRFPRPRTKPLTYWCGEFRPIPLTPEQEDDIRF